MLFLMFEGSDPDEAFPVAFLPCSLRSLSGDFAGIGGAMDVSVCDWCTVEVSFSDSLELPGSSTGRGLVTNCSSCS